MKRFTAYRRRLAERGTHNEYQMNAASEPQFEGVVWSDGTVTLRWLTACKSHSVWASLGDMLRIHGHPEYGTEIVWHDGPPPKLYIEMFGLPKPQPSKVDGVSDSLRERVARAICSSCGDDPDAQGDARGNKYRWQDYGEVANAVFAVLEGEVLARAYYHERDGDYDIYDRGADSHSDCTECVPCVILREYVEK